METNLYYITGFVEASFYVGIALLLAIFIGIIVFIVKMFKKVSQGTALVRTGLRGKKVSFTGMFIVPVIDKDELMDIKLKHIEIQRQGKEGLICADIQVVFFVRVNDTEQDVLRVATSVGCDRASDEAQIRHLFSAKFSEALKTVGKHFEFEELYDQRVEFRDQILKVIGTDLNGFVLDDVSIDYLEQTPTDELNPNNMLDAEGIKKIQGRTARENMEANQIRRDEEREIKRQDVEAQEAILELERQYAESEAKQKREVDSVRAREEAETERVRHEQWQLAERAKLSAEEEIHVAEQNKERSVIVAMRNKERTDAVELERVERDRHLEEIERDRVTSLKAIDRDKAVEIEQRNIQEVIRERVEVEKTVVEEKEKIKDTEAFATAERTRKVAIVAAEQIAQEELVKTIKEAEAEQEAARLKADEQVYTRTKEAEASKAVAERRAEEVVITADAQQEAAEKEATAKKLLAEATTAETAAAGLGEAQIVRAQGDAEAEIIRKKGDAEAGRTTVIGQAEAEVIGSKGASEAEVVRAAGEAEAASINAKAEAMKLFDEVGRDHEEFKLRLDKDKEIELAEINVHRDIAAQQALVLGEALKSAKIDIVGGDGAFFDRIANAVTTGKSVDRIFDNSDTLSTVRDTFFNGDPEYFRQQLQEWIDQFGISSEDLKNLSISAVLHRMIQSSGENGTRSKLESLLGAAERFGMADEKADTVMRRLLS